MDHQHESGDRYVVGDWGSSRLRLFLFEGGAVADSRSGPGIGALTTAPADVLTDLLTPWAGKGLPGGVLLAGMAGSRNGLIEAPYVPLPGEYPSWARASARLMLDDIVVTVAAGLCDEGASGAPDVMRGEETQVFGAMQLEPALCTGPHLLVLPGTHSKWVEVDGGAVRRFRTALTGEVYAALCEYSVLLKAGRGGSSTDPDDADAGFNDGMKRCANLREGLLAGLFETRSSQLLRNRSATWASGFLSGLLIAQEIADLRMSYSIADGVNIIGDRKLAKLYARAFAAHGVETRVLDGAECAVAGLQRLRVDGCRIEPCGNAPSPLSMRSG